MIQFKLISLLLSFAFLFNFLLIKKVSNSALHPSGLFSLFWFICILIPELVVWGYETNIFSTLYIYLSSLMVLIPAIIIKNRTIKIMPFRIYSIKRLKLLFSLISLISILTTIEMLLQNGFNMGEIFLNPFIVSGQYANFRSSGNYEYGLIGVINISTTYTSAALGGIIAQSIINFRIKFFFCLLSFIPTLFLMFLQSQKLILLIGLGYFLGGLFLSALLYGKNFNLQSLISPIKSFFLFSPLIFFSFLSRSHYDGIHISDIELYSLLYKDLINYLFSEIFAFSDFFTCYTGFKCTIQYDFVGTIPGQFTFYSIFSALNLVEESGSILYSQIYQLGTLTPAMQFTIFRWIIQDFGLIGGLVFFLLIGFLFAINFKFINRYKNGPISHVIYISILPFIIFSYVLTIFMARFPLLVALLLFFLLRISILKNESNA